MRISDWSSDVCSSDLGDGLGGVVNIVLKQNASGLDIRAGYSFADGYDVTEAGFTWGKAWSRGSLTVGGSYSDKNSLNLSERSLTADGDYRRFGGYDLRGGVGNVYSLDGCPAAPQLCFAVPIEQRGTLPGLNAPVAGRSDERRVGKECVSTFRSRREP